MRRFMVKRFESSFGAFQQSMEHFRDINQHALTFIETTGKFILDRELIEKIYDQDEDEIDEYLDHYVGRTTQRGLYAKKHHVYQLDTFEYPDRFIKDIHSDLALCKEILLELDKMDLVEDDPKSHCLIDHLENIHLLPSQANRNERLLSSRNMQIPLSIL